MKAQWKALAARVDGLNLRERAFLFLSVIVVLVALVDSLWVSPARIAHQRVRQLFETNAAELQRLRDETRLHALKPNPVQQARDELAQVQSRIAATNNSIAAIGGVLQGATSLQDVLVHFLRRHPSLTLVRTGNVAGDAAPSSRQGAVARQGLELTVAGPYPDLVRFVQSLEAAMPDLRWGPLSLRAEQQSPELTLQVFLVGLRQ